jgi:hypothetical protein
LRCSSFSVGKPQSPPQDHSCYIVIDDRDIVAGTAFAISNTLLLSALHVFEENVRFFITKGIKRDALTGAVSYKDKKKYEVIVQTRGATGIDRLDCVVLSVKDCQLTPIAIEKEIPRIEDTVKFYFAFDAVGFNGSTKESCQIGVNRLQTVSSVSDHHLHTCTGYGMGTSGGPYIKDGKVVAIHVQSNNSIPDIKMEYQTEDEAEESSVSNSVSEEIAGKKRLLVKDVDAKVALLTKDAKKEQSKIKRCMDVLSIVSNSHEQESIGVLIVTCIELCEFLRNNGVDI